jgi:hypothetical protein
MTFIRLRNSMLPAREMPVALYAGVLLSTLFELLGAVLALATLDDTPAQAAGRHFNLGQLQFPLNSAGAWALLVGMAAITWAFRTGRRWARYGAAVFWTLPAAARPLPTSLEAWTHQAYAIGFAACVIAYLFRNDAVEAFFARSTQARATMRAARTHESRT